MSGQIRGRAEGSGQATAAGIARRAARALGRAFADLPDAETMRGIDDETRAAMLSETLSLTNIVALTHLVVALVSAVTFADLSPPGYLPLLLLCIPVPASLSLVGRRVYAARGGSPRSVRVGTVLARCVAAIFGIAWGSMPILLYPVSSPGDRMIIVGLAAGLIADAYVMGDKEECLTIIEAILAHARRLRIKVTAEGVETPVQAEILKAGRCDDIQGFIFSPARPAEEVAALLESLPTRYRSLFPDPARKAA